MEILVLYFLTYHHHSYIDVASMKVIVEKYKSHEPAYVDQVTSCHIITVYLFVHLSIYVHVSIYIYLLGKAVR